MKSLPKADKPARSLRERKRARTFTTIQQQALRLFREQGYNETTVEQIAEAAEVSPSTFFRYFPTKEDVVVRDLYDAMIEEVVRQQPAELTPLQVVRRAFQAVFKQLSAADMAELWERQALARAVPELRAAMLDELVRSMQLVAEALAERVDCAPDDYRVRTFAGVLMGVSLATFTSAIEDATVDVWEQFDANLAFVEAGMPF